MVAGGNKRRGIGDLQAVVFDMDGVLCNTDSLHYRSWQYAIKGLGISFDWEINHKLRGLSRADSLRVLLNGRKISSNDFQAILDRKNDFYVRSLAELGPKNLLPGVIELLRECALQGVKVGVASASQHVTRVVGQLEISELIQAACDSTLVAHSKPAPDPYVYICEKLGVDPKKSIAIEDSPAGVQSAEIAGLCVLGVGEAVANDPSAYPVSSLEGVDLKMLRTIHQEWSENMVLYRSE